MKIGSKIALFYTLLSVLTTIIIIAVFYLFSTQFINKLYASYLREKAYLTAQKHWEKDEVDEQSYQIIQRKYDELLPEAHDPECVRCRNQRTPLASLHLSGFIQFHPDLFSRENLFRPYSYPPAAYTEGAEEDTSQQSEPPVKDDRKQR